jgi:hypothetical protein
MVRTVWTIWWTTLLLSRKDMRKLLVHGRHKRKREGTRPSNFLLQKRQDASRAAKLGVRCILAITSYRCDYSGSKNGVETKAHKTVRHQRTRYVYENQWRNQDGDSEEHRSIRISDHWFVHGDIGLSFDLSSNDAYELLTQAMASSKCSKQW